MFYYSIESHWPVFFFSHGTVYFPRDSRGKSSETFSNFFLRIFESERVKAPNMLTLRIENLSLMHDFLIVNCHPSETGIWIDSCIVLHKPLYDNLSAGFFKIVSFLSRKNIFMKRYKTVLLYKTSRRLSSVELFLFSEGLIATLMKKSSFGYILY